jgi:hypothetical protein
MDKEVIAIVWGAIGIITSIMNALDLLKVSGLTMAAVKCSTNECMVSSVQQLITGNGEL